MSALMLEQFRDSALEVLGRLGLRSDSLGRDSSKIGDYIGHLEALVDAGNLRLSDSALQVDHLERTRAVVERELAEARRERDELRSELEDWRTATGRDTHPEVFDLLGRLRARISDLSREAIESAARRDAYAAEHRAALERLVEAMDNARGRPYPENIAALDEAVKHADSVLCAEPESRNPIFRDLRVRIWNRDGPDTVSIQFTRPLTDAEVAAIPRALLSALHGGWVCIAERLPAVNEPVALVDRRRWENTGDDHERNVHKCGYLSEIASQRIWAVHGERALALDAFTHWCALPPVDALAVAPSVSSSGADAIAAERRRQREREGWSPEHDDDHDNAGMTQAALVYAGHAVFQIRGQPYAPARRPTGEPIAWPWRPEDYKPKDARRNLVRAGALIAAEIDRLDRAALAAFRDPEPKP